MNHTAIEIPYGRSVLRAEVDVPSIEVLHSNASAIPRAGDEDQIVLEAMAAPIGSPRLEELVKGKKTAAIIISDHTRPVPSKHIIPFMLKEMRKGNPSIAITLLVATGFHRVTTKEELVSKLGPEIAEKEHIVVHDCQADNTHAEIGVLPSGARLVLNKAAVETDLLLAEGFIEPHLFSGFSGGRKSVLPGICSRITVMGNHCSKFVASPNSRTGRLEGNPMHEDMIAAARMAKLGFIVNVIINDEKQVVAAFAGHPEAAHYKGCETLLSYCRVKPSRKGDIVISSNGGAPLDQNVYQTVKGLTSAKTAAKKGATLILCAECTDGSGGEDLYRDLRDCASPRALLDKILKVHMDDTEPDQWATQVMAQVLSDYSVIFVSRPQARTMLEEMKFTYAPSLESALQMAWKQQGKDSHHIVIPDGVAVVVED